MNRQQARNAGENMAKPGVIDAALVIVDAFKDVNAPGSALEGYMERFTAAIAAKNPGALTVLAMKFADAFPHAAIEYELQFKPMMGDGKVEIRKDA